jgi:hypothetical protein
LPAFIHKLTEKNKIITSENRPLMRLIYSNRENLALRARSESIGSALVALSV